MFTMLYYPPNRNPELNNLTPEHLNSFTHSPGMWGVGRENLYSTESLRDQGAEGFVNLRALTTSPVTL